MRPDSLLSSNESGPLIKENAVFPDQRGLPHMMKFLSGKLAAFRSCFSRNAAYQWFVIVVMGLLTRGDFLGVTSIINALGLYDGCYECLLHFFRSASYCRQHILSAWLGIVRKDDHLFRFNGRVLLLGDGTKQHKEGRRMPAVKKLHQESEDTSKPAYIWGHMFGGIGAVLTDSVQYFCVPLIFTIQDGLREMASWSDECSEFALSHVVQTIRNAYEAARTLGKSYLVLDRYFLTVPLLTELNRLNGSKHILDVITRAKNSCVAYDPPESSPSKRGRPRKKGASHKLYSLFDESSDKFTEASVSMYGQTEKVLYLSLDLLWGQKLYQELRFVLVKSSRGKCIFASTDLSMDPTKIIESYSYRFKIECTFKSFKQQLGGFLYHFWSKSMPKLNRYKKKSAPSELSQVTDETERRRIINTVEASQRFVLFSCIALGLAQMMALQPNIARAVRKRRFLRTASENKVSEATILEYLRKNIFRFMLRWPDSEITRIIMAHQKPGIDDDFDETWAA